MNTIDCSPIEFIIASSFLLRVVQMELNSAFGQALRQLRKSKGKTQEDFSIVSSRTYLSTLERGKKSPTIEKVDEISGLLGLQPLTLLAATYLLTSGMTVDALLRAAEKELLASGFGGDGTTTDEVGSGARNRL